MLDWQLTVTSLLLFLLLLLSPDTMPTKTS